MFESEEYRIARRFKDFIKNEKPSAYDYIMLRDGRILGIDDYRNMVSTDEINPQDAYVYIKTNWSTSKTAFYYPFIAWYWSDEISDAYLSKLGFYYGDYVVPATGLKYVAAVVGYGEYMVIEVVNLNTAANNLNLPNIVVQALDDKVISGEKVLTDEEYYKIYDMFSFQRLFAGYDINKARGILYNYFDKGEQSLTKEAARIAMEYYRFFNPYRVCYNMETWKGIDCWSIKL